MRIKLQISITILFVFVLSLGCSSASQNPLTTSTDSTNTDEVEELHLGKFKEISGSTYLVAPIKYISESSGGTIRISSSGGGYSHTRNFIYLNLEDESLNRLLSTDKYFIQDSTGHSLPSSPSNRTTDLVDDEGILWWVYSIIKTDSNEDGYLGSDDLMTIGVADVGGQNFTEILEGIEEVLGQEMKNDREMLIIFVKDGMHYMSKIDMLEKTIVETQEILVFESELDQ